MEVVPPYLNETKFIVKLEKEVLFAEKRELRAKKALEFATEYKNLCQDKLDKAKKDEK